MVVFNGVNFIVLCCLGGLHIYWALGGRWALEGVIPRGEDNVANFHPGFVITMLVAGLLFLGALLHVEAGYVFSEFYRQLGLIIMGTLFLLRMIGDFNYVGLFKKKRATLFAQRDTRYYNPLCALVGINALGAAGLFF